VRALEIDSFLRERLPEDLQSVAEARRALGKCAPVQADPVVLVLDRAAADTELEPACRELVEGGRHLDQHHGMPKLVAQQHVSDLDTLGPAEQRGHQGPRLERGILGMPGPYRWS
jgi:hypothetical protein